MKMRSLLAGAMFAVAGAGSAAAQQTVEVILFAGASAMPVYVAQDKGFFAREGLKVNVTATPNSGYQMSNLVAGKYNIAGTAIDNLIAYMEGQGTAKVETKPDLITIMGPSKTESLSGFRLGVAFGTPALVDRMERLQAIVSLRAGGYSQAALDTWFTEPPGWMTQRIAEHQAIRDALLRIFRAAGLPTATPQAGSYLFPELPPLAVDSGTFVRLLRHQAGVTVTPGTEFGPGLERSIRLNFSQDHAAAVAAAERIVRMVETYRA